MSHRRPLLLSPYRMPTNHEIHLGGDEVAAWLHGYLILWHPAVLFKSSILPAVDSAYDHDSPEPGDLFAAPENPPLYQADNWKDRVAEVGAVAFAPQSDWPGTLEALAKALEEVDAREPGNPAHAIFRDADSRKLWETPAEIAFQFLGLGFGYQVVESLYDAMQHEHLLDSADFEGCLRSAVAELLAPTAEGALREHLRQAARILTQARETLSTGKIALLDFWELSESTVEEIASSLQRGDRLTILGFGDSFERHGARLKDFFREAEGGGQAAAMIGGSIAREDAFLPLESQLWNWREGVRQCREALGVPPAGAASATTNFVPQTPSVLKEHGIDRVWLTSRDGAVLSTYYSAVVNWPGPDGKSVDGLTKSAHPAHEAASYFNLAYLLHQAIGADSSPVMIWLHARPHGSAAHRAWRALSDLDPALGQWETVAEYFGETAAGEYAGTLSADEVFLDYLDQRTRRGEAHPISAFPRRHADRRKLDASMTMDAMLHVLNRGAAGGGVGAGEAEFEAGGGDPGDMLAHSAAKWAGRLCGASGTQEGWMVLNPCSFPRRVCLELVDVRGPIPIGGPVKAADFREGRANVVVEVPPLGYSWVPNSGAGQLPKTPAKATGERIIRNEFMEVEIDPATGGIRGVRDLKTKVNRFGQQLVFNPGSKMVAESIAIEGDGPVLAAIVSRGRLSDEHGEPLAGFTQTCRLWSARPLLTVTVNLEPVAPPSGYPWNAYYASRIAWRDERAALFRGINGMAFLTGHNRPQTAEYLEIRSGKNNTCFFPAGLPFHQKPNGRMIDTLLICPGEEARTFTFHFALDRELPQQTALGLISPTPCVKVSSGPPAAGPSSWLFHVDAPNLMLTGMRPSENSIGKGAEIIAQFQEVAGIGGLAEIRCARNPTRAARIDGLGRETAELGCAGDAVSLEYSAHETPRICIRFD